VVTQRPVAPVGYQHQPPFEPDQRCYCLYAAGVADQYVSPLLLVGRPPVSVAPWIRGVHMVSTPHEAARWISIGHMAVVPNSTVAQQAMLLLDSTMKAAMYATGGYEHRWDEALGVQ
jgi:hypothetical protein